MNNIKQYSNHPNLHHVNERQIYVFEQPAERKPLYLPQISSTVRLQPNSVVYILRLSPISEASEEHQNHFNSKILAQQQTRSSQEHEFQQKTCKKYLRCLKRLWRFFCVPQQKWKYDLNDQDFDQLVAKIKSKSYKSRPILPPQKINKKVLVLDLDQTLIYTTFTRPPRYDFEVQFTLQGRKMRSYSIKRFGLDSFLYEMSKLYEIILFTACSKDYSSKVIQKIDPHGLISHKLFRENGITVNNNTFLKNIIPLGRDLQNIIVVDDNRFAGMLQPDNFYQIQTFMGHEKDKHLIRLGNFLRFIHKGQRVTPVKSLRATFQSLQINIDPLNSYDLGSQNSPSLTQMNCPHLHLGKQTSIQAEGLSNEFESQGETTVTILIKTL